MSADRLTALVPVNTESARSVWSTSVYSRAALYLEMQVSPALRSTSKCRLALNPKPQTPVYSRAALYLEMQVSLTQNPKP